MKVSLMIGMALGCTISVFPVHCKAESSPSQILEQASQTFTQGDFPKTLELVEPLLAESKFLREPFRLKILSLVRLGKTSEGVEAYDLLAKKRGRKDEVLLREMAIQSILPFRSDMREQVRGSAYSALKEIQSPEVLPYFQDGLSDGSGMLRVLVVEGIGKFSAGRKSESFRGGAQ